MARFITALVLILFFGSAEVRAEPTITIPPQQVSPSLVQPKVVSAARLDGMIIELTFGLDDKKKTVSWVYHPHAPSADTTDFGERFQRWLTVVLWVSGGLFILFTGLNLALNAVITRRRKLRIQAWRLQRRMAY